MKSMLAAMLCVAMTGCAAFCDSYDQGCINRANAVAAGMAAGGVAVMAGAAAYAASRPVYVAPAPTVVVVCRNPWGC